MDMNETSKDMIAGLDVDEIKIFVGKNSDYYIKKWNSSKNPNKSGGWNWAAFFAGLFWLGYRKMYAVLYSILGVFIVIDIIQALLKVDLNRGIASATAFVMGTTGNAFYFKHMNKRINKIKIESYSREASERDIQKLGGASWGGVGIATLCIVAYLAISMAIGYVIAILI